MKKQDIFEILDEIYAEDASLKKDEKQLIEVISFFSKNTPKVVLSTATKRKLKNEILWEIARKSEKLSFFTYIKYGILALSWTLWVYASFVIFSPFFNQNIEITTLAPENLEIKMLIPDLDDVSEEKELLDVEKEIDNEKKNNTIAESTETPLEKKVENNIKEETTFSDIKDEKVATPTKKVKPFEQIVTDKPEMAFWDLNASDDTSEAAVQESPARIQAFSDTAPLWAEMAWDSMAFSKMAPAPDMMITSWNETEENVFSIETKYQYEWNPILNIPEKMYVYKIKEVQKDEIQDIAFKIDEKMVYSESWEIVESYTSSDLERSLYPISNNIDKLIGSDEMTAGFIYNYETLKNPEIIYLLKNDYYIPAVKFTTVKWEIKIFELIK